MLRYRSMEVKLVPFLETMTDRPTDINRQMDRPGHREVSLPIRIERNKEGFKTTRKEENGDGKYITYLIVCECANASKRIKNNRAKFLLFLVFRSFFLALVRFS